MNPHLQLTVEPGPAIAGRRLAVAVTATAEQAATVTELRVWWKAGWTCPPPLWLPAFALTAGGGRVWDQLVNRRATVVAPGTPGRWDLDLAAAEFPSIPPLRALGLQAEHTLEVQAVTDDLHLATVRLEIEVASAAGAVPDTIVDVEGVRIRCDLPRVRPGDAVDANVSGGPSAVHLVREEVRRGHRPRSRPGRRHHTAATASPDRHGRVRLAVPEGATPTAVLPDGEIRWYLEAGAARLEINVHTA